MRGAKPATVIAMPGQTVDRMKPPAWLGRHAKAEWRRVVPILVERKILTRADLGVFESYCVAIGQVREAQAMIDAEGITIEVEGSFPRVHPAVKLQQAAMGQARLFAAELGLTPVSRSRPAVVSEGARDEWDGLLDD
jgi:P27 family predicted phage terminase small subunit